MARCIVVDLDRCNGCETCVVSCKFQNDLGLGEYWNHVVSMGPNGTFPDVTRYWLPLQCQQCADAPCVDVCPTGSSYRDSANGVVLVDQELCIGCKSCLSACPYSDSEGTAKPSVRWFSEKTQTVGKCILCNQLTAESDGNANTEDPLDPAHRIPPCVANCACGARYFGDLDDANSAAAQAVVRAQQDGKTIHYLDNDGAQPVACYILSENVAEWRGLE